MDTTRGSSRRESARTCASGTKRFSLRLAAEDEIDSSPQRGSEDVYEKVFEKGTPRNNQPNAFDVQPTQPSASQFRFSARRVDVDKVNRIFYPVGRHRRTHQMCTHIVFRVSSHWGVSMSYYERSLMDAPHHFSALLSFALFVRRRYTTSKEGFFIGDTSRRLERSAEREGDFFFHYCRRRRRHRKRFRFGKRNEDLKFAFQSTL